jgi:hypothetical protein
MLNLFIPGGVDVCRVDFMRSNYVSTFKMPIFISEDSFIRKIGYHSKEVTPGDFSIIFSISSDNGQSYTQILDLAVQSGIGERVFVSSILIPSKSFLRVTYLSGTAKVSDIQLSFNIEALCVT